MNLVVILVLAVLAAACSPRSSPPGESKDSPGTARQLKKIADDYCNAFVESYIESEVDRSIADPGQATAYMIGRLEIERLRARAAHSLGSRFDLCQFHDRVLENGSVPLTLLRTHIERSAEWPSPQ